ncbi:MAG: hypothetical protein ABIJ45_03865, partial [Candidatus Zixiibacteriota bacterium]
MKSEFRYGSALIAVVLIFLHLSIYGGTFSITEPEIDTLIYDLNEYINTNHNLVFITNSGAMGRDYNRLFGRQSGWYYPFNGDTLIIQYGGDTGTIMYDAGLVLCGKVNGSIRTAMAIRDVPEFVPGPLDRDTTFPDLSFFEVMKIDTLSTTGDYDYDNWLIPYGAPVDLSGQPLLLGEQTLWTLFNDGDYSAHTNLTGGGTAPLGVEVHLTTYGSSLTGEENMVYQNFKFYNRSDSTIDSFYISLFFDPDIGGPNDDLVGSDSVNNLFFAYNSYDYDNYYQFQIPAWGGKIITGPVIPSPGDTALFDGQTMPDFKNIGLTSVVGLTAASEPVTPEEIFLSASGFDCKTGQPLINPISGETTKFYASGNPVRRSDWVDTIEADKKLMISFGPLTFNPGDSQQVSLKIGAYIDNDRLLSLSYLRHILEPTIPIDSSIDSSDYQPIDSVQLLISDFGLHEARFEPAKERWLTGYDWGGRHFFGGVDYAFNLFGSAIDTVKNPDSFHSIQIRFSNIERQYGYR